MPLTLARLVHASLGSPWDDPTPIREELFGAERLEEHARSLAGVQAVAPRRWRDGRLARRLIDNEAALQAAHLDIEHSIGAGFAITPAAEWLVDNYHLLEARIADIKSDLPPGYYRQLPKLVSGPFAAYPRVLGVAWAFVAHTDSRFDAALLCRFLRAYQEVQPLTIGELWAVSITLRIVMVENLRRLADRIAQSRDARQAANAAADRLLGVAGVVAEPVPFVLADLHFTDVPDAFAVQLVHRLRDQDPGVMPALTWLDERLAAQHTTIERTVHDEHQRQGAANVTVRNIITSLRNIADVDWSDIFEQVSVVDATLRDGMADETVPFTEMDFATRNLYRSAIEELARGSAHTELEIAHVAVQSARSKAADSDGRQRDPGWHLLMDGRPALEASLGFRAPTRTWLRRLNTRLGIGLYLGITAVVALAVLCYPLLIIAGFGMTGVALIVLGLIGVMPSIDAAVCLVNRAVAQSFSARPLPSLALRDGVPTHLRTLIAVPMMLTTEHAIRQQAERLEVHHLASPGGDLHYVMLGDFVDAPSEHLDGDAALLAIAVACIARLNRRHPPGPGGPRFLLLHRRRVWNDSERRWIGWERKRGKLHELNRVLRGATDTTYQGAGGACPDVPAQVRYIITLDADTRLPRDTVRRLIGKLAHPLNAPRFDPVLGRVVEGYAVLQPRVTPSLPVGNEGSVFQRIFSSMNGIDPYAGASSDVYQDLFGEGSYAGKGIYEVDAFEAALARRVPDSMLLSHDLFEGIFARAGLASDVEVVEEFPSRYYVAAMRQHRWARGDWQLLPWIIGAGPRFGLHRSGQIGMPPNGRWKMRDNLRRTLSAPACIAALFAGWFLPPHAALTWTIFILLTIGLPAILPVLGDLLPRRPRTTWQSYLSSLQADVRLGAGLWLLTVTFLAHQASLMIDAIIRTLFRVFVSHQHLLEWVTAAQATLDPRLSVSGFYRRMASAPLIGCSALVLALISGHGAWLLAAPLAALWIASPAVARWVSVSPCDAGHIPVTESDASALRLAARRTWRFFECFVTEADHMLPPDNFQETPRPVLAHRTSPTNIGLYLLAVVSARDFGWIGTGDAISRLEATLATMQRLARFRGHFYNWYDTQDLRSLEPRYVSAVDSGNLAGHLLALANACRAWRHCPPPRDYAGALDAIALAQSEAASLRGEGNTQTVTWQQLDYMLSELATMARGTGSGLAALAATLTDIAATLAAENGDGTAHDLMFWVGAAQAAIDGQCRDQDAQAAQNPPWVQRLRALEAIARDTALAMEFGFLLDPERRLLSIGYQPDEEKLDPSCYDLLASEARLASFIAIAKGDVPARHWFRLGRTVVPVPGGAALVSWSGSMFEYLMPSLVMRAPRDSLLEQTNRLIVRRQQAYGETLGLPWGVSESAYNVRDLEFTYQYSNFGVPGLGLKRGLGDNQVVAPYATALASMVDPRAAASNLARLAGIGAAGRYGFYEALDATASRLPAGDRLAIVRAFMAHHQGMSIVAIADTLFNGAMRARFHAEPIVQATELLLQERMPRDIVPALPRLSEVRSHGTVRTSEPPGERRFTAAASATPATHLLSNGNYAVMLTSAGSGYSRWRGLAVTRWHADTTCDAQGSYIYLRDIETGAAWTACLQPAGRVPEQYDVAFNEGRASFARRDGTLITSLEIIVSAEDDAEVRCVTLMNEGTQTRVVEITSYAELVLGPAAADTAHPAFSKMFVETEYLPALGCLLATRRRREPNEPEIWVAHVAVVDGNSVGEPEIETDRARFLGRGHGPRTAIAAIDGRALSNTVGTVLDPVLALRRRVSVAPGKSVRVAYWTVAASSRTGVLDLIDTHRDAAAFDRAATLAWTQAQVQLYHLGIDTTEAGLFQRLAGHVLYPSPSLRPSSAAILRGAGAQSGLWPLGISGDLPIVLLRITDAENLDVARQVLRAHEYWGIRQLPVDLVILNERDTSYIQDLQVALESMVRVSQGRLLPGVPLPPGQVFVLRSDLVAKHACALLGSVARVVLVGQRGRLADQLDRIVATPPRPAAKRTRDLPASVRPHTAPMAALEFFNGLGGFADDGREYVTRLGPGQSTPAPWINVVANPEFGFEVAAEGGGSTWSRNSRENRVTPWPNDPISNRSGEAFYLSERETGALWSPTAWPIRDPAATYTACHGRGYSRFEHLANEIGSDLLQFVPIADPVKISRLTLRNLSAHAREISVTCYVEWVLGPTRAASVPFTATEIDPETRAMFARNIWYESFASRVAFADMNGKQTDWTGDRTEFIGRNGSLASPAALTEAACLSKTVGAGLDPCGALRAHVTIPAGGTAEIVFLIGEAADAGAARALVNRYRSADLDDVMQAVTRQWTEILDAVHVDTPERSLDIMLNGWLLYQALACRMWGRAAFYQASGAFGFRDQLQDSMALTAACPALARAHLIRAASRQFVQGDVQHWWLPHSGQGVRTRISDDRAWLAYAASHYVKVAGDSAVLDEVIPFLEGQMLAPGEHDSFFHPSISDQSATLFEHCARALEHSLAVGAHGLPLMGTGDWNDGMNRVGEGGLGESVWLGWFLYAALTQFVPLAQARHEHERAAAWQAHAAQIQAALEEHAWDGEWYRRGYFDDGTPLGSAGSQECRIDSIAQSWAVLSGAADPARAQIGMASVERELIDSASALALLFTPPFDKTTLEPGYIKAYPPGIRENGGQYTHAALWSVMAFAALGQAETALQLLLMLNPINHARNRAELYRYTVEPYVVAADIYAAPGHEGRGGWTWYTGAAGWTQRAGIESILGIRLRGAELHIDPCIPASWPGFSASIRYKSARYDVVVKNPNGVRRGVQSLALDGSALGQLPLYVPLVDDGLVHKVLVALG